MKHYREIKLVDGTRAPSSTIQGIKKLLLKGKLKPGQFTCVCPSGNIHVWDIVCDRVHTTVGYAPRKKAARIGGKQSKSHFQAKLNKVINNEEIK